MYRVSVIIPVYNNEDTLEVVIDSFLNQTMPGFELILINDGSTDRTAQICDAYAEQEPLLIEVMHQEHHGEYAALNRGIMKSTGKYIYFANPHDYFERRLLETNIKMAEEKDVDMVVFGFTTRVNTNELERHLPRLPLITNQLQFRNHFRNFYHFYPYELFNKIYNRDFIIRNHAFFSLNSSYSQHYFNMNLYKDISSVAFNREIYVHRTNTISEVSLKLDSFFEEYKMFIVYFEKVLTNWSLKEEYKDLIAEEYYYLVYQKLIHLNESGNILAFEQQLEQVMNLINDPDLRPHLKYLDKINKQSTFDKLLIFQMRKGNGKKVIDLFSRRDGAINLRTNVKQIMKKIFD